MNDIVSTWLSRLSSSETGRRDVEVAFYGGSFTGLPEKRQKQLFEAVFPFLQKGTVARLRLSTRPDYISPESLALLSYYQVKIVELGVQSMDDGVLFQSARGHSCEDVRKAVSLLKEKSFQVCMQLMVGLPGQSCQSVRRTVRQTIALRPDFIRIYPVVVVRGSALGKLYQQKMYSPLSLKQAVLQTAYMKKQFEAYGIQVIRMGLQAGESLEDSLLAGPYHPAFGEMVYAKIMLQQTRKILARRKAGEDVQLIINKKDMSIFRGVGSANMYKLSELGLRDTFSLQTSSEHPRYQVGVL